RNHSGIACGALQPDVVLPSASPRCRLRSLPPLPPHSGSRFEGDELMSEVFFRVAGIEDMAAFLILKGSVYVEPVRISGLGQGLADGHGVLGELADGTPVAGRFQRPICPDLLGDG